MGFFLFNFLEKESFSFLLVGTFCFQRSHLYKKVILLIDCISTSDQMLGVCWEKVLNGHFKKKIYSVKIQKEYFVNFILINFNFLHFFSCLFLLVIIYLTWYFWLLNFIVRFTTLYILSRDSCFNRDKNIILDEYVEYKGFKFLSLFLYIYIYYIYIYIYERKRTRERNYIDCSTLKYCHFLNLICKF